MHTKRIVLRLVTLVLLLLVTTASSALAVATAAPADIFAINARLGRAINFGNALEANYEGEWGMVIKEEYFSTVAQAGFQTVRIPIRFPAHAQKRSPYTLDARFMKRIDWVVEQAQKNGLMVILDMHHNTGLDSAPKLFKPQLLALWQQLAEHYQTQPDSVLFELHNEPHDKLTAIPWNAIIPDVLKVIRRSNPTRGVIVGPAEWNNLHQLATLKLPADDRYLIVTFHYYDPFHFTHQGADWVDGGKDWLGTPWTGSASERNAVDGDFDRAAAWAKKEQRPLFMGEFGAYSKAKMADRARWTAYVVQAAQQHGMSFAYWEFGSGFGAYNPASRQWNQPLLDALIQ